MAIHAPAVYFYFNHPFVFKKRRLLKKHIILLFEQEHKQLQSLTYVFCSDEQLYELNQQFLHHDTYTDILTFPLSSPPTACNWRNLYQHGKSERQRFRVTHSCFSRIGACNVSRLFTPLWVQRQDGPAKIGYDN